MSMPVFLTYLHWKLLNNLSLVRFGSSTAGLGVLVTGVYPGRQSSIMKRVMVTPACPASATTRLELAQYQSSVIWSVVGLRM